MAGPRTVSKDELFELIVESSTDFAIFTLDGDGIATSWNVGAERLFGYSEKEMLGEPADSIFTVEDRAAGVPEKEMAVARRHGRAADERWHRRKDGSRFWASGLMMPLKDPAGGFVKIARDRTEQHRARELLRANEERFRLLATSIPQLVFRTSPDGQRTWASPQWLDFTGLDIEASLGLGWLDAVHPDDRQLTRDAWQAAREQEHYHVEHRIWHEASGEYRWHQTRARPLEDAALTADWVGTMTDIHDLRGLQDRQRMLMAELQHRTRNLLAVVQSIANQTIRSSPSPQSFKSEFEGRLRALGRVQSLLAHVDSRDIDLHALVTAELAAHGHNAVGMGKSTIDGPPVSLPATSAQALGLALHELATNAVKYGAMAQPGGRLAVSWTIETIGSEQRVALDWRESGVTMPKDGQARRQGYGSELIVRALPYQLKATTMLEFGPDGVRCAIAVPISGDQPEKADG